MFKTESLDSLSRRTTGLALAAIVLVVGAAGTPSLAAEAPESAPPAAEEQRSSDSQGVGASGGGSASTDADAQKKKKKKGSPVTARYENGLIVESADGNYYSHINWRGQFRLTDVSSPDLVGEEDGVQEEAGFLIRRARFKMKGHAYRPWLEYKFEYGLVGNILLTFRMNMAKVKQANLWLGQYKVLYNRERVDSSGKQQFVDRSIVNSPFTVDRQQGLTVTGRLFEGKRADSNYAFGIFTGTGRGGDLEGDRDPMYVGRWQWNFLKRVLPYSQSATKHHDKAHASIAIAASTNTSQFTRFSSSGGGQLPGFESTDNPSRYKLEQWMAEWAYQRRGLSSQAEYHFKRIDDREAQTTTEIDGWYAQIGYFFNDVWEKFPEPLEFALRAAEVDVIEAPPGPPVEIPANEELTLAANWFFNGHSNKLTFDTSRLKSTIGAGSEDDGWRARLQWDIQF